ncbi:hypothetical protein L7F22_036403 [Adiantum nelumboides]|nr:hypothetical protein [Adiantum nelumboides]
MADNNTDVFKMFAAEDRLDGDNYPMWAYMMQHVLVSKGVWNIVKGIGVRLGSEDVDKIEDVAGLAAKMAAVRAVLPIAEQAPKSAKHAWDIMASHYAGRNEAKIALLRKELESKIMNEEDDMDTFLAGVKDVNEQLIFVGEVISDSSLVQTVLDALPDSYLTFDSTWRLMNQRNPEVVKFDEDFMDEGSHTLVDDLERHDNLTSFDNFVMDRIQEMLNRICTQLQGLDANVKDFAEAIKATIYANEGNLADMHGCKLEEHVAALQKKVASLKVHLNKLNALMIRFSNILGCLKL